MHEDGVQKREWEPPCPVGEREHPGQERGARGGPPRGQATKNLREEAGRRQGREGPGCRARGPRPHLRAQGLGGGARQPSRTLIHVPWNHEAGGLMGNGLGLAGRVTRQPGRDGTGLGQTHSQTRALFLDFSPPASRQRRRNAERIAAAHRPPPLFPARPGALGGNTRLRNAGGTRDPRSPNPRFSRHTRNTQRPPLRRPT